MIYQIYQENKKLFQNSLLLIQSGSWYTVFNEDANMIHYLMGYKINYNLKYRKVSFPRTSFHAVKFILDKKEVNYMIFDGNQCSFQVHYPNNQYHSLLFASNNNQMRKKEILEVIMRDLDKKQITELEIIKQKLGIK